mgnify:FL=1
MYDGLNNSINNLFRLSDSQTRSISSENVTGEKGRGGMAETGPGSGAARDLGRGWKINPCTWIPAHTTVTLADIDGSGCINHIWCTVTGSWRYQILRIYWDDSETPSVECPVGDFFATGWGKYSPISSLAVCVNPGSAFNCYWQMPFRKRCRMTLENIDDREQAIFYQIDYTLTAVPSDAAYFHAQFRRVNPLPYKDVFTILDGVRGKGQYVGTVLSWGVHNSGWWGEGEIKFYLDGDDDYPTICGTGTEDYFCGSYDFENQATHRYETFTTPYAGLSYVSMADQIFCPGQRFGLYRWHITDPIRFESDLRVTIQALGWRDGGRYLPLQDDIASVAFWYQTLPAAPFPKLPEKDELEII